MSLIECKNISFSYEGKTIVSELSFNVEAGDYVCIVGENGSGKSTLIKGLLGLKAPSSGKIIFGGGLTQKEIGYLPQQTGIQRNFPASVREVVLSGTLGKSPLRPFYSLKEKNIAEQNMEKLGILNLSKRCYRELSGGQQQRVLLARALCATKRLILLDEPVAGLDPIVTSEMYSLIKKLNREDNITVIMVSHDIHSTIDDSTHILHMGARPLYFGKTENYIESDVGKIFLCGEHSRREGHPKKEKCSDTEANSSISGCSKNTDDIKRGDHDD